MKTKTKQIVIVNIIGKPVMQFPLHHEEDKGFVCTTGTGESSPATEWFAKSSLNVTARRVNVIPN